MRTLGIVLLALGLTTVLLGPVAQEASADHVYTHRYLILGRAVDLDGTPVAGAQVTLELDGWFPRDEGIAGSGMCREGGAQRVDERTWATATSPRGDYEFCLHAHQLQPAGRVVVTIGNTTEVGEKDTKIRMTLIDLIVPEGGGQGQADIAGFENNLRVQGRVWQPLSSTQPIEGIPAQGVSPVDRPVNATLELADGTVAGSAETRTDNYGQFTMEIPTDADLEGAQVVFRTPAGGETYEERVDVKPDFRAVYHKLIVPDELTTGNGTPGVGVFGALLAVVVATGLAVAVPRIRG